MKPEYFKARLQAELGGGRLPESFGVITACNPHGRTVSAEENSLRTDSFRRFLKEGGYEFFPVRGYDPDTLHQEPGFGVVCDEKKAVEIGRERGQEAIFHVVSGRVHLISCGNPAERYLLGDWSAMTDDAG
jgi:hypothetical protein